ncbi:hypothetical protein TVAG_031020 [Trichomonas vaginalis G3]|uniref:Uncharacterized protein n=1 Tax=Trichomonas vaginalis (strain ATCC PRA-98 / G3) TaxID=412133 RepID=A2EYL0_TRIV3|nr:hypothetical protein TVAGG3_0585740 [Trichomonas vaginalis G3]EAY02286.1 hypothetical protein TVAG_031020 [Trichomonas vaginalis G3]KAI5522878.1 hypothetical protein TVAGG3_0585740 [Trichomonas vaginalis G3]|eukprot:XP_001314603.1 hypothetical protein [Trichomonas vaginalis G3]
MNLLSIRLTSSYDNANVYSVSHFVLSETLFIILFNLSLSYPITLSHPASLFGGRGHCSIPYAASLGLYKLIIRFKISDNATKTQRYSEKVTSLLYMFPVETHLIISLFLQTQCKNLQSLLTPNGERDVDRTYGWSAADDHLRCSLNEQMTARAAVPVGCRLDMQSETAFAFTSRSLLISLSFIWNLDSMRRFVQIHFSTQTIALSSIVLKHILPNKMC